MRTILLFTFITIWLSLNAQNIVINEFMSLNNSTIVDEDGEFVDWIELFNNSNSAINLNNYKISDDTNNTDKWIFPEILIEPSGFVLIFASGKDRPDQSFLHTNFKIKSEGEYIILSSPADSIIDIVEPISLPADKSFGRLIDGIDKWVSHFPSTPNYSNNNKYPERKIKYSKKPGFYSSPFFLRLNCEDTIYYTLNGSEPTINSSIFSDSIFVSNTSENNISLIPTNPIPYSENYRSNRLSGWQAPANNINKATIIRAKSYRNSTATSKTHTYSYFTNDFYYTFPVISLISDSLNFFDDTSGIYVPGIYLDSNNIDWTGNYYQRGDNWERVGNIEYFDTSGNIEISQNIGFRIHGQKSRMAPQKSLRIYARTEYGKPYIDYPFFDERNYWSYKRLILRCSYTSWWRRNTLFQDDLIHTIVSESSSTLDVQMTKPSIL
ncbi:MAG: hypothetical protein HN704_06090 [Bacteroidetes bacterium]|jgi:hypothetical protein|nr:hypothetical protein [Bacteroidota bacterium]MBT6686476.1 hypothetical protein [Bacteroidota bacterium]MBT7142705.1 hypothetical protein [Bacteroidota bacterium]MBT7491157.1 hypothetical protein [Bacteroidota bacterium]